MIHFLVPTILILSCKSLLLSTPKDIISQSLAAIFQENNLNLSQTSIIRCLDDDSAASIVKFISVSLQKGQKGSITDLISLLNDLHNFYDQLPQQLKLCLHHNQELLKVNYKYGIGYLPLAQSRFKDYVQSNYLKTHQQLGLISDQWNNRQDYYQASYSFASFGHQVFPISKKVIRGVWLTNVGSAALDSRDNIQQAVEQCYRAHINTIFVVVYNNARTIYPSSVMYDLIGIKQQEKFNGRDPLQQLIQIAKQYAIEVHAWFQYGFSSSYSEQGGIIVAKRPSWKALDVQGNLVVKNGFDWLNGFDPEVQNFMLSLIKEVINNYQVDGVQGDDRLPALPSIAGYEPYTIAVYKSEHDGKQPPADHLDPDWILWRANKLNDFMKRIYLQTKALKLNIYLSMAPSPYPWSLNEYLQDWPTWVKYNWVDAVLPQCYRYNFAAYQSVLKQQLGYWINEKTTFAPGILLNIGDYTANTTFLSEMVGANRKLNAEGQSFFYYEGIVRQSRWFQYDYTAIVGQQVTAK